MLRHVISLYRDAFGGLARETWVLVAVALVNRAGTMVLPFLTLYLTRELRFDKGEAGWVIFAFGIGSVIGTFAGGRLSDRVGAIPVQLFSLIAGGAGFLLLGLLRTVPALMAGFAVLGMLGDATWASRWGRSSGACWLSSITSGCSWWTGAPAAWRPRCSG